MGHLRAVLQHFMEHQLFVEYIMLEFLLRLVAFHGHIISSEGILVYQKKKNWLRI